MPAPAPPASLPTYLAEGLPKQDLDTLEDVQAYVEALIDEHKQPIEAGELPDSADPVENDDGSKGTVVKEKVRCGDDSCICASGNGADMHGPYLYRYYREKGTVTSEYVGKP